MALIDGIPRGEVMRSRAVKAGMVLALILVAGPLFAQESDTEDSWSKDDRKGRQWSFQGTWVHHAAYHDDQLPSSDPRPEGISGFFQARVALRVTPIKFIKVPIISRLTIQQTRSQQDGWGTAPTELFSLFLPGDWGTGQFGIGPLVRFPAANQTFGDINYTFGFSTGVVQRVRKHKLLFALLIRQTWGKTDPLDPTRLVAQPMSVNPVINLRLGGGYYIQNGGTVGVLNWQNDEFFLPFALRVGRVFITPRGGWNISAEYKTSGIFSDWSGPATRHAFRFSVAYTLKGPPDLMSVFD